MRDLKIEKFMVGPIKTNVYLVFNEKTKKAFLVDCAGLADEYIDYIKKNNLDLEFVVVTHGHHDHIDALNKFLSEFDIPYYISKKEEHMLINPMDNGSLMIGSSIVINKSPQFVVDGQKIKFEDKELEIIETPGHTRGGISIKFGDWLFSGDTLFYHTVGRTDFPYADAEQLRSSIQQKLFTLKGDIKVFPGHGRETSILEEKGNNPFI